MPRPIEYETVLGPTGINGLAVNHNVPVLSSAPTNPSEGDMYFNTATQSLYIRSSGIWQPPAH